MHYCNEGAKGQVLEVRGFASTDCAVGTFVNFCEHLYSPTVVDLWRSLYNIHLSIFVNNQEVFDIGVFVCCMCVIVCWVCVA